MQITYTQYAWANMSYNTMEGIKSGRQTPLLSSSAPGEGGYFETEGHALIGTATVTLTINTDDEIVQGQVAALNTQLQAVRAEAQQKENQILRQISQLQALTMA